MTGKNNAIHENSVFAVTRLDPFEELFDTDRTVIIHTRNLQILATKMFKVYKSLSPTIVENFYAH